MFCKVDIKIGDKIENIFLEYDDPEVHKLGIDFSEMKKRY